MMRFKDTQGNDSLNGNNYSDEQQEKVDISLIL